MLAAIACGLACGLDLEVCIGAIAETEPVFGRFSVHPVPDGPVFVLDSYKAAFWTLPSSLAFLETAHAPRKTVIFGTVSDYAGNARRTYRKIARQALAIADRVIFVGPHASHAEALRAETKDRLLAFATTYEASRFLQQESQPGELILVKASGGDHLERIALSHFGDIVCWRERCGKARSCPNCLHYRTPSAPPLAEFLVEQDKTRAQGLSGIDAEAHAAS
jgi:UDP-N-acetylmuramoyl-tripeptide--D-alanyl-D-alanine ligase